ncbi:DUF3775 domain-containing protein [Methylosinus sp. KRF6]|uniref:DUF3775 domain-containing protein n=1 Tax=Methylosinus sp. KRF6 TaxID=2846853 RepID=UPI001C0C2C38|nr:DUF3775 domain-containing protein [Methylosinus sp. KRF6]MBU3889773.1 DUF3775 domain-containing protein [Methylosinus sp. KRF6]
MLTELRSDQARFIALLAKTARLQRDKFLGNVAEEDLNEIEPSRGEHNPTASLGFDPLDSGSEQMKSLRAAIDELTPTARTELYALMRIGQGHLAARDWARGFSDATLLDESTITATLLDDADLHDHLIKGLYETGTA